MDCPKNAKLLEFSLQNVGHSFMGFNFRYPIKFLLGRAEKDTLLLWQKNSPCESLP